MNITFQLEKTEASQLAAWLDEQGITYTRQDPPPSSAALPVIPIIGLVVATGAAAKIVLWIREKLACQQTIYWHDDAPRHKTDCKHRNGKILIFGKDGALLDIDNPGELIDLTEVAKAAMGSLDTARDIVHQAGGKAHIIPPA